MTGLGVIPAEPIMKSRVQLEEGAYVLHPSGLPPRPFVIVAGQTTVVATQ